MKKNNIDEFLETNVFKLGTEWQGADGNATWSRKVTVKIFKDEDEYKKYKTNLIERRKKTA